MSQEDSAETRARRGMALLIERLGERWDERVDLTSLDIGSYCRCVLGQLFGAFHLGAPIIGVTPDHVEFGKRMQHNGFLAVYRALLGSIAADANDLTAAWRDLIARQRAQRLRIRQEVTA